MITLAFVLATTLAWSAGAEVLHEDHYALPVHVQFFDLSTDLKTRVDAMLGDATTLIAAHPPRPNHLFHWSVDRALLENKAYRLIFADSRASQSRAEVLPLSGIEGRGGSYVQEDEHGHTLATTVIFIDRYFGQADDRRNRYVFPHLVLDLARHIYGIVQIYLDSPIIAGTDETMDVEEELGFAVVLKFLDQFLAGDRFQTVDRDTREAMLAAHAGLSRQRDELTRCGVHLSPAAPPAGGPVRH